MSTSTSTHQPPDSNTTSTAVSTKRKRTPSNEQPHAASQGPALPLHNSHFPSTPSSSAPTAIAGAGASAAATANHHPHQPITAQPHQINYTTRAQSYLDLPLLSPEDSQTSILQILSAYHGVLDRNESLASSLGSVPQNASIARRFETLFSGPPSVIAIDSDSSRVSPQQSVPSVSWQEVVQFAQTHPSDLLLGRPTTAKRTASSPLVGWYTHPTAQGFRVEIQEREYHLIKSDLPLRLLQSDASSSPNQHQNQEQNQSQAEDEEKELGTLEILERAVGQITGLADQVAAAGRRVNRRFKGRREALLSNNSGELAQSGVRGVVMEDLSRTFATVRQRQAQAQSHGIENGGPQQQQQQHQTAQMTPASTRRTKTPKNNHTTPASAAANVFDQSNLPYWPPSNQPHTTTTSTYPPPYTPIPAQNNRRRKSSLPPSSSNYPPPVPTNTTPTTTTPPDPPHIQQLHHYVSTLPRGTPINPPCDRCRRLRIDCTKNLSACSGCTRKHARCTWRDVAPEEMGLGQQQQGEFGMGMGMGQGQGQGMGGENVEGEGEEGMALGMPDENGNANGNADGNRNADGSADADADLGDREQEERDAVHQLALFAESAAANAHAHASAHGAASAAVAAGNAAGNPGIGGGTVEGMKREAEAGAPVANMGGS